MDPNVEIKYQKLKEGFNFHFEDWDTRWEDITEEEYLIYKISRDCKGIRKILIRGPIILEILEEYSQFGEDLFRIKD